MDRQHAPWDAGGGGPIRRRPSTKKPVHRDNASRVSLFHGPHCSTSLTALAADDAIQRLLYIKCLARAAHASVLQPRPHRFAASESAASLLALPALPESPWVLRGLVAGALVVAAATLAMTCLPSRVPDHSVAGVVLVGRQPLIEGRIVFHPAHADPSRKPLGYQTDRDGSFRSTAEHGIPGGLYVIVVESGSIGPVRAGGHAAIPAMYRDVATTPLRVHVTENLTGLRLLIRK